MLFPYYLSYKKSVMLYWCIWWEMISKAISLYNKTLGCTDAYKDTISEAGKWHGVIFVEQNISKYRCQYLRLFWIMRLETERLSSPIIDKHLKSCHLFYIFCLMNLNFVWLKMAPMLPASAELTQDCKAVSIRMKNWRYFINKFMTRL